MAVEAGSETGPATPGAATAQTTPPTSTQSHPALPRLVTSTKRTSLSRPPSFAKNRLSTLSNSSRAASRRSSHVVPVFEENVPHTLIRDFAYSVLHPLHFGPPPEPSEPNSLVSTPVSESHRRLSDPARATWGASLGGWSAGPWGGDGSGNGPHTLPPSMLSEGLSYADDDDDEHAQSPVASSRHKRHKTTTGAYGGGHGRGRGRGGVAADHADGRAPSAFGVYSQYYDEERGYYTGTREDGSETYYVGEADAAADGPGGEYVTYPPEQARHSGFGPYGSRNQQRDSHFAITLPNRSYVDHHPSAAATGLASEQQYSSDDALSSPGGPHGGGLGRRRGAGANGFDDDDDDDDEVDDEDDTLGGVAAGGRRNGLGYAYADGSGGGGGVGGDGGSYQYSIASPPDEDMHGKAIALFDFERENENELPLVEGQVIWVAYRHGQGWLVAEDPHTRESGLVPEEYVRLLRDIGGAWPPPNDFADGVDGVDDVGSGVDGVDGVGEVADSDAHLSESPAHDDNNVVGDGYVAAYGANVDDNRTPTATAADAKTPTVRSSFHFLNGDGGGSGGGEIAEGAQLHQQQQQEQEREQRRERERQRQLIHQDGETDEERAVADDKAGHATAQSAEDPPSSIRHDTSTKRDDGEAQTLKPPPAGAKELPQQQQHQPPLPSPSSTAILAAPSSSSASLKQAASVPEMSSALSPSALSKRASSSTPSPLLHHQNGQPKELETKARGSGGGGGGGGGGGSGARAVGDANPSANLLGSRSSLARTNDALHI